MVARTCDFVGEDGLEDFAFLFLFFDSHGEWIVFGRIL